MMSDGSDFKLWKPSIKSLKSSHAKFVKVLGELPLDVTWAFSEIEHSLKIGRIVMCELVVGSSSTNYGVAEGLLLKTAMLKSFAEAWERFWCSGSSSSNGFAAGDSMESAFSSAREELLEREIFLQAWQSQRGWVEVLSRSVVSRIVISQLKSRGWKTRLFRIDQGSLGFLLAGMSQHPSLGTVFDCVFVPSAGSFNAKCLKLLLTLERQVLFMKVERSPSFSLAPEAEPDDHRKFYAIPENAVAFMFLDNPDICARPLPVVEAVSSIKSRIVAAFSGFPFVAQAHNPDWNNLTWGTDSITGENPWPHPLA